MSDITIIDKTDRVEALFLPLREMIGADYAPYRNHVYRVLTYAMHFLDGDEEARPLVETALVYHDIGMWSDGELAYLEPSEALALAHNEANAWGLDPALLRAAIHWHHKLLPYRGPDARIVNAVRRADWIDASGGKIRHGVPRAQIRKARSSVCTRLARATGLVR